MTKIPHLFPAALALALLLAILSPAVAAGTSSVSTTVTVTARVVKRASLGNIVMPDFIVTEADVARGSTQTNDVAVVEIRNNSRNGCLLAILPGSIPFKEAVVTVLGRSVMIGEDGGMILLPLTGKAVVTLSCRLVLRDGVRPGTRGAPFSLSIEPL